MILLNYFECFILSLLQPSGPSNGPPGALPPSCPGPRQPFAGNTQYGPPPGAPILPPGGSGTVSGNTGSHTTTPSSHGASPTPSSGSGGGSSGHWIPGGGHPPGYPACQIGGDNRPRGNDRFRKNRTRNQQQQSSQLAAPASNTPPTSPAKRSGRGKANIYFGY